MMMNPAIDHLLQKLFGVNNLEEAAAPDIELLAGKYPYYAPLQYLLANKYRQVDDHTQYRLQITKTAVFFSNPHWLNDLLLSDEEGEPASPEAAQSELVQDGSSRAEHIMPPELPAQNAPAPGWALPEEKAEADDIPAADPVEILSPEAPPLPAATEDHEVQSPAETPSVAETITAEPQEGISGEEPVSSGNTAGEGPKPQEEGSQNASGFSEQHENSNAAPGEPGVRKEIPSQQEEDLPVTDPSGMITGKKPLQQLSDTGDNLPVIPFEPLYTVDYFASQGIQLTNEEGSDKLSRKLRSFTEWLKTMKRIHPEKLEQEMDRGKAAAIQHIAEHSNELEDVVTEAMAEVYARQGLRAKAAEVYQKLSLLNPNKRAYFAARISKLNDI